MERERERAICPNTQGNWVCTLENCLSFTFRMRNFRSHCWKTKSIFQNVYISSICIYIALTADFTSVQIFIFNFVSLASRFSTFRCVGIPRYRTIALLNAKCLKHFPNHGYYLYHIKYSHFTKMRTEFASIFRTAKFNPRCISLLSPFQFIAIKFYFKQIISVSAFQLQTHLIRSSDWKKVATIAIKHEIACLVIIKDIEVTSLFPFDQSYLLYYLNFPLPTLFHAKKVKDK